MSCAFATEWVGGDGDWLAHNPEVAFGPVPAQRHETALAPANRTLNDRLSSGAAGSKLARVFGRLIVGRNCAPMTGVAAKSIAVLMCRGCRSNCSARAAPAARG